MALSSEGSLRARRSRLSGEDPKVVRHELFERLGVERPTHTSAISPPGRTKIVVGIPSPPDGPEELAPLVDGGVVRDAGFPRQIDARAPSVACVSLRTRALVRKVVSNIPQQRWHSDCRSTPTAPIDGPFLGSSRHFFLPSLEGGQDLPLLTLGHPKMIERAAKLRIDLVEHSGWNLQVEMGVA
jgi:hypothetical protein